MSENSFIVVDDPNPTPTERMQEWFNIIWEHAKKGQKSMAHARCAYRGDGGAKCFVGAVIPDDEYFPIMEDVGAAMLTVVRACPPCLRHASKSERSFLNLCQRVHDRDRVEEWGKLLVQVAHKFGLSVPKEGGVK